jgi:hypothetical protein
MQFFVYSFDLNPWTYRSISHTYVLFLFCKFKFKWICKTLRLVIGVDSCAIRHMFVYSSCELLVNFKFEVQLLSIIGLLRVALYALLPLFLWDLFFPPFLTSLILLFDFLSDFSSCLLSFLSFCSSFSKSGQSCLIWHFLLHL